MKAKKKLNAQELRNSNPGKREVASIKRNPIYLVLDEIIDTYNIGSLFRLADAIGATEMTLCGDMEYPPNSRIHKAAVGTEAWVPWRREKSTLKAIKRLKDEGVFILAIEQDPRATNYKLLTENNVSFPVAIVVGNETKGIDVGVLDNVDTIVELPMYGINTSFNTWGCAAVVAYKVLESLS